MRIRQLLGPPVGARRTQKPRPDTSDMGTGAVLLSLLLRRRAAQQGGPLVGRADARRRQLNAGVAPVFPAPKRKSRSAKCGPALQLLGLEETVPPSSIKGKGP